MTEEETELLETDEGMVEEERVTDEGMAEEERATDEGMAEEERLQDTQEETELLETVAEEERVSNGSLVSFVKIQDLMSYLIKCPSDEHKDFCTIDRILTVTAALTNLSPTVVK